MDATQVIKNRDEAMRMYNPDYVINMRKKEQEALAQALSLISEQYTELARLKKGYRPLLGEGQLQDRIRELEAELEIKDQAILALQTTLQNRAELATTTAKDAPETTGFFKFFARKDKKND